MSSPSAVPPDKGRAGGGDGGATHLLVASGLVKNYRMGAVTVQVLRTCSVSVRAGEFVAIMGASGSGKSTLLHILGALDVPDRGNVRLDGIDVFAPESSRRMFTSATDVFSRHERRRIGLRRREFGFIFQFYHLLPELNVLENVVLPLMIDSPTFGWASRKGEARDRATDVLRRVGLAERLLHRPNQLSGGERQRVAIARALVHRPRVLYADEPTGNLDAKAGAGILEILHEFHAGGQTIVMVTHDASVAATADRVMSLENGVLKGGDRNSRVAQATG